MIRRIGCVGTGLGLVIVTLLIAAAPAGAVESFGVGARPANPRPDNPRTQSIFVYDASPGSTVSDALIVANNSQSKKVISLYGVDSQNSSDGAFACAQAADAKTTVGSWIQLGQSEVTLGPGQQAKVPFTLSVPGSADVGEHNGCIAIQPSDAVAAQQQNGISLSFRSAIRVAVTIPGELKSDLKVAGVTHDFSKNKFIITPTLKNTGNISVDAAITTSLLSFFGTRVASANGTFPVLRDTNGTFNFEADKPFWGGYYTLVTRASYKPLATVGTQSRPTNEVRETVFITPHPLAIVLELAAISAIAGVIGFVIWRRHRHNEHLMFSRHHKVKEGEDIEAIGADYGVSWKLVARINKIKPPYTIKPGETLLIPGRKARKSK